MLIAESAYLLPIDGNTTDHFTILQHRNAKNRAGTGTQQAGTSSRVPLISWFRLHVSDVHSLFRYQRSFQRCAGSGVPQRVAPPLFGKFSWHTMHRNGAKRISLGSKQEAKLRLTQSDGVR